jgi:hypothetical protein
MKSLLLSQMATAASVCLLPLLLEAAPITTLQARRFHLVRHCGSDSDPWDHPTWHKVGRSWKGITFAMDGFHKLSKQVAVHIASRSFSPTTLPRFLCISSVACVCAVNLAMKQSEATQRACIFWKRAGPIVAHYKFTEVRLLT